MMPSVNPNAGSVANRQAPSVSSDPSEVAPAKLPEGSSGPQGLAAQGPGAAAGGTARSGATPNLDPAFLPEVGAALQDTDIDAVSRTKVRNSRSNSSRDTLDSERSPGVGDKSRERPVDDRRLVRNPMERVRTSGRDAPAHAFGHAVGMDVEIDVSTMIQGKLIGLGRFASNSNVLKAFDRIMGGLTMTSDDSQSLVARKQGLDRMAMRGEVSRLVTTMEKTAGDKRMSHLQRALRQLSLGSDPQAFVQRVMRESYAIGNEVMKDFADRMRKTNALRKQIRAEAKRTREAITRNAGKDDTDALDAPFSMMELDRARNQLNEAFYSQQEAEAMRAETEAAVAEAGESADSKPAPQTPPGQHSELADGDRSKLKRWGRDKDLIEKNEHLIAMLMEKASDNEIRSLFGPILQELADDRKENELLDVLRALEPRTFFVALGQGGFLHDVWGDERDQLQDLKDDHLDRLGKEMGIDLHAVFKAGSSSAEIENSSRAVVEALDKHELELRSGSADGNSDDGRVGSEAEISEVPDPVVAGDPKKARTVRELADYEKYLEDQLNSVGDDAQLLNVDLQNQLQRQQQVLQMMSNISKAMHDAAMGIVRNIAS